jgi:NAD(P)-dependent dehydrogenase (short-subunit alcohol dehydrogenase family)
MEPEVEALLNMEGRSALVTGGAQGIGRGIAELLVAAGARVVIGDIDVERAEAAAAEIGALAMHLDVSEPASADTVVAAVPEIDLLINNAGSWLEAGSILDQSHASWRRSIDVNLGGVFNCSKAAAMSMVAGGRPGSIINISSVDGYLPSLGSGYDAAKAAVIQLTRSLAVDLAPHGIRANGVAPGPVPVETRQRQLRGELPPLWPDDSSPSGLMGPLFRQRSANLPLGRKGTPADIAHAVLFLASAASSWMTGQTLVVDGGYLLI